MIDTATAHTCISHCTYVTVIGKDTVWSVLTSVPHWIGEFTCSITLDAILGLGLYPLGKRWLKRHDAKNHSDILVESK